MGLTRNKTRMPIFIVTKKDVMQCNIDVFLIFLLLDNNGVL